jgi:hypothetical protein
VEIDGDNASVELRGDDNTVVLAGGNGSIDFRGTNGHLAIGADSGNWVNYFQNAGNLDIQRLADWNWSGAPGANTLVFYRDASDFTFARIGSTLQMTVSSTSQIVTVASEFAGNSWADNAIQQILFLNDDGEFTTWDGAQIASAAPAVVADDNLSVTTALADDVVILSGSYDSATASGSHETVISTGTANSVTLTGSQDTTTVLGDDSSVTDGGTGDTTTLSGNNDHAEITGANATVTATGTGSVVNLEGDSGQVYLNGTNGAVQGSGNGATVAVNGQNATVTLFNASITLADGVSAAVGGDGDEIFLGSAVGLTMAGTGSDRLHVSGDGNADTLSFGSGVAYDQLWFAQSGNDLTISVIGVNRSVTVTDWFSSVADHVGQIQADGGYTLSDQGAQHLVEAMTSFSRPPAGQTTLPPELAANLAPALAANWQHI